VHKLAQSVLDYIRKHDLLRPGNRCGVAVSSGADSVALLRLMLELRDELGIVLSVVHLNHKLRGAESDADEQFVRDLAHSNGLEIAAESFDVKTLSLEKKLSLETAARTVRYEFFERLLKTSDMDKIATAHSLDDQAETVLLKFLRGAGTRGLAGIYPKRVVTETIIGQDQSDRARQNKEIIRPLLGTRRSELREYLVSLGQSWREDVSNEDLRHTRNRIRHQILPRLHRELNPAVCEVLAQTAEIARAEEDYWSNEISRLLPQLWRADKCGGTLKLSSRSLPLALRRRLVRAAAESLGIALEFAHVGGILGDDEVTNLSGRWRVTRHDDLITFGKIGHSVSDYQYELAVPGQVIVTEAGIMLETSVLSGLLDSPGDCDLVQSRFAQEKWVVRNWRPGECFWPVHTKEPKKIKELLQDRHIVGLCKKLWPVIAAGNEVIWVSGLGVGQDFRSGAANGVLIRQLETGNR
jgi:tRNA(Ile)-lysidine synthase